LDPLRSCGGHIDLDGALAKTKNNVTKSAMLLGVTRATIHNYIAILSCKNIGSR
jgi:hypothetical protein